MGLNTSPALVAALVAVPLAAGAAPPASAPDLEPALTQVSRQLQRAWRGDPLTARLPPPRPLLLPAARTIAQECPGTAGSAAEAPATFCPATGTVLLDRTTVENTFDIYQQGGVAFWLALGLAQAVPLQRAEAADQAVPPAATSLQRLCLAGTLLGAMPAADPAAHRRILQQAVKTARVAYAPSLAPVVGTPGQRAYALLSGTGGTRFTCSAAHMRQLAAGTVPDPELIERLTANRDPSVGIESFCRQPPACPRRLGASVGVGAI